LHIFKGVDYSNSLTVKNLLAHTSGLPDYFEDNSEERKSLLLKLHEGVDHGWSFEKIMEISKKMTPKFAPNTKGKAYYSDTNFQLLGKITENIYGEKLA